METQEVTRYDTRYDLDDSGRQRDFDRDDTRQEDKQRDPGGCLCGVHYVS